MTTNLSGLLGNSFLLDLPTYQSATKMKLLHGIKGFLMRILETKPGRTFLVRLEHESDLLDSIRKIAQQREIQAARFFAIGAVKKAAFSFYNQRKKKYVKERVQKELELLSCLGNISKMEGKTIVHAHVAFSDSRGKFYGGHLTEGTVVFAGEVSMTELIAPKLERKFDEVTGLNLFDL
jgi:predicted DNA-binding protein with PD1-like motif